MPKNAKNAGESVTPATHPDPKVWKWCKHKECMTKVRLLQKAGFQVEENQQRIATKRPRLRAVFLEEYCWKHLPDAAKVGYKAKIETWVGKGYSLEGANLYRVELRGAYLDGAYLQEANLKEAKLQGAKLHWSDLQETNVIKANLQNASLAGANLQGANLSSTDLYGAFLRGIQLDGAKGLTWGQVERVGEEIYKKWGKARDAYLRLKNYFHQQGLYTDESKAYYREKLMAKKAAFAEKKRWRGLLLALSQVLTGFGEHWWKTALWALGVIGAFWITFWIIGAATGHICFQIDLGVAPMWLQYLYFSVVTFATLGFGDIAPKCAGVQALVIFEVIFGYVFLGLIITIIARRFGR